MKRGNENSQLRPDEVEDLNEEESEERGMFRRASAEVLASRKIFKTRRPQESTVTPVASVLPQPVVSVTSSASETTAANPFASFQGLSAKPTASAAPTQGAVQAANPFAGFQGLSSKPAEPVAPVKAAANPFAGFSGLQTGTPQSLVVSAVQGNDGLASTSTSVTKTEVESPSDASNHYKKKMRKLNTSFFNWTKRQMEDHPLSIWKDGIKDYIRYADELNAKFGAGSGAAVSTTDNGGSSSSSSCSCNGSSSKTLEKVNGTTVASFVETKSDSLDSAGPSTAFGSTTNAFAFPVPAAPSSAPMAFPALAAKVAADSTVPAPLSFAPPSTFTGTFAFKPTATAASSAAAPAPFSGFSGFGLPSTTNSFAFTPAPGFGLAPAAAAATGGGDEEEGGDDEGEPILEPEKVLRNDQDTDDILVEASCKLFGFSKESKEWKDTGKGSFRVTRDRITNKQRMLVRNPIGKLTFNANFYQGMKFDRVKNAIRFSAFVVIDEPVIGRGPAAKPVPELKGFMVKLKDSDVESVLSKLEAGVAACE